MNINEVKEGITVSHKKFGKGIVVEVTPEKNTVDIEFLRLDGTKEVRKIRVDFVEKSIEKSVIPPASENLTPNIDYIIGEDELDNDVVQSSFRVVPSNYTDQSCYSTATKRLLTYLRRTYPEEGIATIKSYSNDDMRIGVFLVPTKGIIVFGLVEADFDVTAMSSPLFESILSHKFEPIRKYYVNRFLQSRTLCEFVDNSYKVLKYPVRVVLLLQNVDLGKIPQEQRRTIKITNRDVFFRNFTTLFEDNELFSHFEQFDNERFESIGQDIFGAVIERVVPENVTLVSIAPSKKIPIKQCVNPEFHPITGTEREFSALCLDDTQIKTINETKPGHYLTLADPGTGKSVLLVSKAYRIQSLANDNHVLVTCYNNNLAEHHSIFAAVSGMKTANLHIMTFHKLVKDLLEKVDPGFVKLHPLEDADNFGILVNRFEELLNAGKIDSKLNAVFIDEVQLFEPKWIDICYRLVDKRDSKDYFFEMYGDINQDVKSQRSKGKASWQNTKDIPSLQGRVRKLDRNYRNTNIIAGYIKCMISEFNDFLNKHNLPVDPESACLSSETLRQGSLRVKVLVSSQQDVSKVIRTINELVSKKKADYNEIAVVYPAKGYSQYYSPLFHIEKSLEKVGIPYSRIHGDGRQRLFECDGVILSTIDSCLGLDFNYVILCGLHYWELNYEKHIGMRKLDQKAILFDQDAVVYLSEVGKKIYSACSRAREGLFIVDDLSSNSPIKGILRPHTGERFYNEY